MPAVQSGEPSRTDILVPGGRFVAKAQRAEDIIDQIRRSQIQRYGVARGEGACRLGDLHHLRFTASSGGYGELATGPGGAGSALRRVRNSASRSTSGWTGPRGRGVR